eukprot:12356316-Alexandrium_andersonii.AAC.1
MDFKPEKLPFVVRSVNVTALRGHLGSMLDAMQSGNDEGGDPSASITCVQEHAVVKSSVKP